VFYTFVVWFLICFDIGFEADFISKAATLMRGKAAIYDKLVFCK
jgi:hypothetical protein